MNTTSPISARVDETTLKDLDRLAEELDRSRSWLVAQAVSIKPMPNALMILTRFRVLDVFMVLSLTVGFLILHDAHWKTAVPNRFSNSLLFVPHHLNSVRG